MNKVISLLIASFLIFSVQANTEKSFYDRLNRLKEIVDIDFEYGLNFKDKAIGLTNLEKLLNSGRNQDLYFGENKIIKKVIITNEAPFDPAFNTPNNFTLFYLYDGSENENLTAGMLEKFENLHHKISIIQNQMLIPINENFKFVRNVANYQTSTANHIYAAFLVDLYNVISLSGDHELLDKVTQLDEIKVIDQWDMIGFTTANFHEIKDYLDPTKKMKSLTINFKTGARTEAPRDRSPVLFDLLSITLIHGFQTISYVGNDEDIYKNALSNLNSALKFNQYPARLKAAGVKGLYINSSWNTTDEVFKDGILTVGTTIDEIKELFELFLW